jgi:hypothetical protein
VRGVGKVSGERLAGVAAESGQVARMRALSETLAAFWKAVDTTKDPARRAELLERYGEKLVLESNRYATSMEELGLRGPFG